MRRSLSGALLVTFALAAGAAWRMHAQSPPASPPAEPGEEALLWERDFDLLLDLKNIPTHAEILRESRIQALRQERQTLRKRLAELQARSAAIQGTFTTEALLNEMLRQGASSVQQVQKNLKDEMDKITTRMREIDDQLRRLGATREG